MRKRAATLTALVFAAVAFQTTPAWAVDFGTGNIAVYRVAGTAATSAAVFIDEYTPTGTRIRSVAMPTATVGVNRRMTGKGNDKSEGMLTRSGDGETLVATGYDAATGATIASTTSAAVPRVVGLVDCATNIDTSTALTNVLNQNEVRGAYSSDGSKIWVFGDNDVDASAGTFFTTAGATTGLNIIPSDVNGSQRHLEAYSGQLYTSGSGNGTGIRFASLGVGLPETLVSPPVYTSIVTATTPPSPYAFYFADLSATEAGLDTAYITDDSASGGGILKYNKVSGTWLARGLITVASSSANIRGLAATTSGSSVTLYATTTQTAGGLFKATDNTGYNVNASGAATQIATADANTSYRGVALAPTGCLGAVVPEAPLALLLPLSGVALAATLTALGRSRRAFAAA